MFTSGLHRDRAGLASMEVVLGLPVFLIMLLALKHACAFSLTRIQNLVSDRTSTWHYARNEGSCPATFELDVAALMKFLLGDGPSCSDVTDESITEKDKFWDDLKQAASWSYGDLVSRVRGAPAHDWGKAELDVSYSVPEAKIASFTSWQESYAVPKARFLMFDEGNLDEGYNGPIRGALGPTMGLFPGLFGQQD